MRNKVKEHLTKNESAILLAQPNKRTLLGKRDFCILSIMLRAGLRRQELADLKRKNFIIEQDILWLYVWGKGKRQRKIPIQDIDLFETLRKYFVEVDTLDKPEAPAFFNVKNGKPITAETIRRLIEKYIKKARVGKHITPHSLRHSCLTLHLQEGADLATVQAIAGHANISTTSRYLHTTEENLKKAAARLSL